MIPSWIDLSSQPIFQDLAWTLVHFFWQGALIALVVRGALGLGRRTDARWRYGVACAGLLLMALAPVLTWHHLRTTDGGVVAAAGAMAPSTIVEGQVATVAPSPRVDATPTAVQAATPAPWNTGWLRAKGLLEPALPWISLAWLLGVALLSAVHVGGLWRLRQLRTQGAEPLSGPSLTTARRLLRRLQVRREVRFLTSTLAQVPMVVGSLRPALLVPVAALHGLPPAQLEAILAHELAHIRRRDALVNWLQVVVETLLFYHPAVWWLSDQVRELREHCCDDLAAEACGDVLVVARALTELEALRPAPGVPQLALGATGGSLARRVRRLLGQPGPRDGRRSLPGALLALAVTAVSAATVVAQSVPAPPQPPSPPAAPEVPAVPAAPAVPLPELVPTAPTPPAAPLAAASPATPVVPVAPTAPTVVAPRPLSPLDLVPHPSPPAPPSPPTAASPAPAPRAPAVVPSADGRVAVPAPRVRPAPAPPRPGTVPQARVFAPAPRPAPEADWDRLGSASETAEGITGPFRISNRGGDRHQLTVGLLDGGHWSFGIAGGEFEGTRRGPGSRFSLTRDAGVLTFEADLDGEGAGQGTYRFVGDADFRALVDRLGFGAADPSQQLELTLADVDRPLVEGLADRDFRIDGVQGLVEIAIHGVDLEFIDGLAAAGYDDLPIDKVIELAIHGVDPDFIARVADAGYGDLPIDKVIELSIHGVDARFVAQIADAGYTDLPIDKVIELAIHGVDANYITRIADAGYRGLDVDRIAEMAIHGVDPDFVTRIADAGYRDLPADKIIELAIHGVDADYITRIADSGYRDLPIDRVVEMAIHGVDPDFVRAMADAGYDDLSADGVIEMAIHGIDEGFVRGLADAGYSDLSAERLVEFSIHGVTPSYIQRLERNGVSGLTADELLERRIHGD